MPAAAERPPHPFPGSSQHEDPRWLGCCFRRLEQEVPQRAPHPPPFPREAEASAEPLPICCLGRGPGHTPRALLALSGG